MPRVRLLDWVRKNRNCGWDLAFLQIPKLLLGTHRRVASQGRLGERGLVLIIRETLGLELAKRLSRGLPRRASLVLVPINEIASALALEIYGRGERVTEGPGENRWGVVGVILLRGQGHAGKGTSAHDRRSGWVDDGSRQWNGLFYTRKYRGAVKGSLALNQGSVQGLLGVCLNQGAVQGSFQGSQACLNQGAFKGSLACLNQGVIQGSFHS